MKKLILIASTSFDEHSYGPVSRILDERGYGVVVYKTDRLISGEDRFVIDLRGKDPFITYNGVSINPQDISAAWYRKVGSFALADVDAQLAKQLHMNNEVRSRHDTIWPHFYPENLWLSAPANLLRADRKLHQLSVARAIGFVTPATIVSSSWEAIDTTLLTTKDARIIVKMMRGVISENNEIRALPTTILDEEAISNLGEYTSPFPGIYQPYLEKAREWRVTVVGDQVFPVAVYTDDSAKDDWRQHQNSSAVRFEVAELAGEIKDLCVRYLTEMKLGFGAFDLVECPNGEVVFLECNPNGQYSWLEEDLGLSISTSIAEELMKIAQIN